MNALAIVIVMLIALWSITQTLEKLTKRILDSHQKQMELLEEIKAKLEEKSEQ